MKNLVTLPIALFLAIIFSCNKSDVSPPGSAQSRLKTHTLTNATLKNLNVLLFDAVKAADKTGIHQGEHLHLFDVSYLTDGSKALIESNMTYGLTELKLNAVIPPGTPTFSREADGPLWSYCINDGVSMTGFFLDYYVTDNLKANPVKLAAFKLWFEKVAVDWMNLNNLAPKSKTPEKPGEYWKKIIGSVS